MTAAQPPADVRRSSQFFTIHLEDSMKKTWLFESSWATRALWAVLVVMLVALGLMATSRPAAAQQVTPCYVNHIVQPGQYIAQIARLYSVTPQSIMAANPQVTNPNLIFPGQVLVVPTCGTVPIQPPQPPIINPPGPGTGGIPGTCRWWHSVTPGQTMLSISRLYGVSPFAIAEANRIFNLNLIYAGTTLCVP
jgi:LysM repeat protein